MRTMKNLVALTVGVCAVAHCGKAPKKDSAEKAPQVNQPVEDTAHIPFKKVTNTTYSFTLKPELKSCEDFKKRLDWTTYEFELTFKNYLDVDQTEKANFMVDDLVCNPGDERFTISASSPDSTAFNAAFHFKFENNAATLTYGLDDCFARVPDRVLDKIPRGDRELNDHEQVKTVRTVNDNFCVPAVGKLAEAIVRDLSL